MEVLLLTIYVYKFPKGVENQLFFPCRSLFSIYTVSGGSGAFLSATAEMANIVKGVMDVVRPNLMTFIRFAKVELTPPSPGEFGQVAQGMKNIISGAKNGKWKNLTVREAWLNTLVATEVACWFFIGECIGKRNLIGYDVHV